MIPRLRSVVFRLQFSRLIRSVLLVAGGLALAACGGGGDGGDNGGGGGGGGGTVTISGQITFERVPFATDLNRGLDYAATSEQPVREVVVQLLNESKNNVLQTTTTDASGNYSLTANASTNVIVRALAETRRTGTPSWDVQVLNNTNGNALYALDSASFNTGTANVIKDLLAPSGWPDLNGTSYATERAAAPFAILDTIYSAMQFVLDNGDSILAFPTLKVFWSTQNHASDTWNPTSGNIVSTSFQPVEVNGAPVGMYVQGLQNNDTDEYDQSVLAHEFQHYLEDAFGRSDSIGGPHATGDKLDLRVAFSEGFGNAFSGMVLGSPLYSDSGGQSQSQRLVTFNVDTESTIPSGWYSESSVESIVWDLYDSGSGDDDALAVGYGPMFDVFRAELRTGPALTSIYPFIVALKTRVSSGVADQIDTLVQNQLIFGTDAFGSGETNSGGVTDNNGVPLTLPIYTSVTVGGSEQRVCGTRSAGYYNIIGNRRFLTFSLSATQSVTIRADYTSLGSTFPFSPTADPDIWLYEGGFLASAESDASNTETLTRTLDAGAYVIEVFDYSHVNPDPDLTPNDRRGITCFNVSVM